MTLRAGIAPASLLRRAALLLLALLAQGAHAEAPGVVIAERVDRAMPVAETVPVMAAPDALATPMTRLRAGFRADILGIVEGGQWLEVRLPYGTGTGYIPRFAVPALAGAPGPTAAPPEPRRIAGMALVRDTALLVVEDETIRLADLVGSGGEHAAALQAFIDAQGARVLCEERAPARFVCRLPDGADIAEAALVNGAARMLPSAPDRYRIQQEAAQLARRGVWQ